MEKKDQQARLVSVEATELRVRMVYPARREKLVSLAHLVALVHRVMQGNLEKMVKGVPREISALQGKLGTQAKSVWLAPSEAKDKEGNQADRAKKEHMESLGPLGIQVYRGQGDNQAGKVTVVAREDLGHVVCQDLRVPLDQMERRVESVTKDPLAKTAAMEIREVLVNQDLSAMEGRVVLRETKAPAVCPARLALREPLAHLERRERRAFQDHLDCEEMLATSVSRELPGQEELKEKLVRQEKVGPMANQVKMVKMELRVYAANQVREEGRETQARSDRQGKLEKKGLMVVEVTAENKALKDSLVRLGQLETKEKLVSLGPMVPWAHQGNVVAEA